MLPPGALALLIPHDRSREQPIVTGYATAPPETARSARLSYQQRVAVNHQLSSHWVGRLLSAKFSRIMEFYVPNGTLRAPIWCQPGRPRVVAGGRGPAPEGSPPAASRRGRG